MRKYRLHNGGLQENKKKLLKICLLTLCISLFYRGGTQEPTFQRLYVGSIHFSLTEDDLRQIFEPFGPLDFVNLHKGKDKTERRRRANHFIT